MEKLGETQLQKAQFIEQSRERLRELSVAVSAPCDVHGPLTHRLA